MKVKFVLSEDDYAAFNLFYVRHNLSFKRWIWLLQLGGAAVLLMLGAFVGMRRGGVTLEEMSLFLLAAILFALYVPNQVKSTVEKWGQHAIDKQKNSIPMGERTLVLLDGVLSIQDQTGEQQIPLTDIIHTIRDKKHLFLITGEKEVVVIPLSAFETLDDEQLFYSALPHRESLDQ